MTNSDIHAETSDDGLDLLLARFFAAEVPAHVPMPNIQALRVDPIVPSSILPTPTDPLLSKPRVTLATSMALLLGGVYAVSSLTQPAAAPIVRPDSGDPANIDATTAKLPKFDKGSPMIDPQEPDMINPLGFPKK